MEFVGFWFGVGFQSNSEGCCGAGWSLFGSYASIQGQEQDCRLLSTLLYFMLLGIDSGLHHGSGDGLLIVSFLGVFSGL